MEEFSVQGLIHETLFPCCFPNQVHMIMSWLLGFSILGHPSGLCSLFPGSCSGCYFRVPSSYIIKCLHAEVGTCIYMIPFKSYTACETSHIPPKSPGLTISKRRVYHWNWKQLCHPLLPPFLSRPLVLGRTHPPLPTPMTSCSSSNMEAPSDTYLHSLQMHGALLCLNTDFFIPFVIVLCCHIRRNHFKRYNRKLELNQRNPSTRAY